MPFLYTCPKCGKQVATKLMPTAVMCLRCGRQMTKQVLSDEEFRAQFGKTRRQKYVPAWRRNQQ